MSDGPNNESRQSDQTRRQPVAKMAGALTGMSPLKKKVLAFFLAVAAIGAGLWGYGWAQQRHAADPAPRTASVEQDVAPEADSTLDGVAGRSFVEGRPTGTTPEPADTASEEEAETAAAPAMPWTGRLGGWMAKLGLSFAGGLVMGVFFRTFLKTMAAITALVASAIVLLSYFELINVDFTTMRTNYDSFAEWLTAQGWKLKDLVAGVLPSAVASGAGFFMGFLKK